MQVPHFKWRLRNAFQPTNTGLLSSPVNIGSEIPHDITGVMKYFPVLYKINEQPIKIRKVPDEFHFKDLINGEKNQNKKGNLQ